MKNGGLARVASKSAQIPEWYDLFGRECRPTKVDAMYSHSFGSQYGWTGSGIGKVPEGTMGEQEEQRHVG